MLSGTDSSLFLCVILLSKLLRVVNSHSDQMWSAEFIASITATLETTGLVIFFFYTGFPWAVPPDRTHSFQGHSEALLIQQKQL